MLPHGRGTSPALTRPSIRRQWTTNDDDDATTRGSDASSLWSSSITDFAFGSFGWNHARSPHDSVRASAEISFRLVFVAASAFISSLNPRVRKVCDSTYDDDDDDGVCESALGEIDSERNGIKPVTQHRGERESVNHQS